MIFLRLMIEKTFPYSYQVLNYSSISNKLFDVMAVSLSYFPLLDIDLFFFSYFPPFPPFVEKENDIGAYQQFLASN